MKKLIIIIGAVGLVVGAAYTYLSGEYGRYEFYPIPLFADNDWYQTDIYLRVESERIDETAEQFRKAARTEDAPLIRLFDLLDEGDRRNIRTYIHPDVFKSQNAPDVNDFVVGAVENFTTADSIVIERRIQLGVERVYLLDVVLGEVKAKTTMRFRSQEDSPNEYLYVPFGIETPENTLLEAWTRGRMRDRAGFAVSVFPASLAFELGGGYRADLSEGSHPATLVFDGTTDQSDPVLSMIAQAGDLARARNWDQLMNLHTPESGKYLGATFADRTSSDYLQYLDDLGGIDPKFLIEGGDVSIVYSGYLNNPGATINYVLQTEDGPKVANAGVLPVSFHVFTNQRVMKGLETDPPFVEMTVN